MNGRANIIIKDSTFDKQFCTVKILEPCPSSDESGQSIVEAVLLMLVFMAVVTLVTNQLQENNVASRLVSAPWKKFDNMIRYGSWSDDEEQALSNHPNQNKKHSTVTPN